MKNLAKYDVIRVFDADALRRNFERMRGMTNARLGITVKSDAYGFGLSRALPVFEKAGVRDYFVQGMIEAVRVRSILNTGNIYAYAGVQDGQAEEFVKNSIIPVCISLKQLEYFNDHAKGLKKKPQAGIHFDTGMHRTGLSMADVDTLAVNWEKLTENLDIALYLSHLHGPFDSEKISRGQLALFRKILEKLPKRTASLAATSGLTRMGSEYHFDLVRPGYGIYGVAKGMEQPLSVYAKILQIREVAKGETIGYSDEYTTKRKMKIAVLNIGYNDGYSRNLSKTNGLFNWIRAKMSVGGGTTRAYALVGKTRCPVVGIVSMNNVIIDVGGVPDDALHNAVWAKIAGEGVPISLFRTAIGYAPAEMLVDLTRDNPNALDISPDEFEKIKSKIA